MLLIASAIAFSLATVKVPGGVFELPAGCTGLEEITVHGDLYMGLISCNENRTNILVEGSAGAPAPCAAREAAELMSRHDARLVVCQRERIDRVSKKRIEMLFVEVGSGSLSGDIKELHDAFLLLQLASSYRPDRKQ